METGTSPEGTIQGQPMQRGMKDFKLEKQNWGMPNLCLSVRHHDPASIHERHEWAKTTYPHAIAESLNGTVAGGVTGLRACAVAGCIAGLGACATAGSGTGCRAKLSDDACSSQPDAYTRLLRVGMGSKNRTVRVYTGCQSIWA